MVKKPLKDDNMDGKNILDSIIYLNEHRFSDAIKLWDGEEIYFVFKTETIAIKPNTSRNHFNPIRLIRQKNESKTNVSGLTIEPIAYILKIKIDGVYKYHINSINKKSSDYVKKNKRTIMNEFRDILLNQNK